MKSSKNTPVSLSLILENSFNKLFTIQVSTISSSKNIKSNLNQETKSSSLKKNESLSPIGKLKNFKCFQLFSSIIQLFLLFKVTGVGNSRKARIEKSKNKINSIINSTRTETTCTMCLQSYSNVSYL